MKRSKYVQKIITGIFIIGFITSSLTVSAQDDKNTPVSFTLADRDRIMLTEQKLDALEGSISKQFDAQSERFNDKLGNIHTLLYFLLGGMFGLVGFVLWDRRTFLKPVKDKNKALEQKLKNVVESLIEKSKKDTELAAILRMHNLL